MNFDLSALDKIPADQPAARRGGRFNPRVQGRPRAQTQTESQQTVAEPAGQSHAEESALPSATQASEAAGIVPDGTTASTDQEPSAKRAGKHDSGGRPAKRVRAAAKTSAPAETADGLTGSAADQSNDGIAAEQPVTGDGGIAPGQASLEELPAQAQPRKGRKFAPAAAGRRPARRQPGTGSDAAGPSGAATGDAPAGAQQHGQSFTALMTAATDGADDGEALPAQPEAHAAGELPSQDAGNADLALTAVDANEGEEPSGSRPRRRTGRQNGKGKREKKNSLAEQKLDLNTMSLKQIIKWSYARERSKLEELKRQKEDLGEADDEDQQRLIDPAPPASLSLAPQVQIVDGRIVINQTSLTVQAQPEQQYRRVVEDQQLLNSASYSNRIQSERWSVEDTELFYKAIRQFGTDFTLIERLFPGRARRSIKNKFNKEYRINAARVDEALQGGGNTSDQYREMISLLQNAGGATDANGAPIEGDALPDFSSVLLLDEPAAAAVELTQSAEDASPGDPATTVGGSTQAAPPTTSAAAEGASPAAGSQDTPAERPPRAAARTVAALTPAERRALAAARTVAGRKKAAAAKQVAAKSAAAAKAGAEAGPSAGQSSPAALGNAAAEAPSSDGTIAAPTGTAPAAEPAVTAPVASQAGAEAPEPPSGSQPATKGRARAVKPRVNAAAGRRPAAPATAQAGAAAAPGPAAAPAGAATGTGPATAGRAQASRQAFDAALDAAATAAAAKQAAAGRYASLAAAAGVSQADWEEEGVY